MKIIYPVTSKFKASESFRNSPHTGMDFAMPEGTELKAVKEGVVRIIDYGNANAGKTVFIDGADGNTYIYGHLSEFKVMDGEYVNAGELIGLSGNTGFSTGPHLHFGVKANGTYVDPEPYAPFIQQMNVTELAAEPFIKTTDFFSGTFDMFLESLREFTFQFIHFALSADIVGTIIGMLQQLF